MARPPTRFALAPLLGLLAITGGQAVALAHLALVAHETCEHGDIVDGGHEAPASTGERHDDEHEHCSALACLKTRADGIGPGPSVGSSPVTDAPPVDGGTARISRRALWRLAPKQSPPA